MKKFRVSYPIVQYADMCIEIKANSSDEALEKAKKQSLPYQWYIEEENSNGWETLDNGKDGPDYEVIEID